MLRINEIFGPTIQGEGKSLGMKVLFLRLAMCNLHCVWCDTAYTWRFNSIHPHNDNVVYDRKDEVHEMTHEEVFQRLNALQCKALVISGGEPFLQQKKLLPLLRSLKSEGWWIEIETNGTVKPLPEFLDLLDQVNCSPKLSNSGDPINLREKPNALKVLSESSKTNFKFVVANSSDVNEIDSLVSKYGMKDVYAMPEGRTVSELKAHEEMVKALKYRFTPRQHIILFGSRRAV